jgi:hypothetical protein
MTSGKSGQVWVRTLAAANLTKTQKLAENRKGAHAAFKKADRFGFAPRQESEYENAQEFFETAGPMSGDLESESFGTATGRACKGSGIH